MPSTYTLNNGIELIGTGEQSGTWGDTTNTNFELLDTALDGQVSVTLSATGSTGSPNTLPVSDGAASNGRNRLVIFGDSGDIGGTVYVQLTPNDAEKIIYVRNNLSGSRSILLFQGTYNASNDYEVPAGTTAVVFFNGAGSGAVAANVFNNAHFDALNVVGSVTVGGGVTVTGTVDAGTVEFDNLSGTGAVSVTNILDEDNMASNSATALSTQQSIKAYVDSQVGTVDTLAEILANGNTTGGTDIVVSANDVISLDDGTNALPSLTTTGDLNTGIYFPAADEVGITTGGTQRVKVDSTGVNVTGTVTATGTSVFASLDISGDIDVDGTTNLDVVDIDGAVDFASTTAHAGNATFADDAKAIFGAGSDLQIYHDGLHSYIEEAGTGRLHFKSNSYIFYNAAGTERAIDFLENDEVRLYFDGDEKLATTSTGIDITGTITSDGLTVDGLAKIQGTATGLVINETDTTDLNTYFNANSGDFNLMTTNDAFTSFTTRLNVDHSTGDISFYEDTGSTAKLVWTAADESLGIGGIETTDTYPLMVKSNSSHHGIHIEENSGGEGYTLGVDADGDLGFYNSGAATASVTFDDSGNVGIGGNPTNASDHKSLALFGAANTGAGFIEFNDTSGNADGAIFADNGTLFINADYDNTTASSSIRFRIDGSSEKMRITSAGDLLVGTTDTTVYDNSTASSASNGHNIRADGKADHARYTTSATAPVLGLNRVGSFGYLAEFRKDGGVVGSISTHFGSPMFGKVGGARLAFATSSMYPSNDSGTTENGTLDIGTSSGRFKDLYLSGGVYLGGTAATNKLDDYEDGSWTVNLYKGGSAIAVTNRYGYYRRVGDLLHISFYWLNSSITTTGTSVYSIQGMPFNLIALANGAYQFCPVGYNSIDSNNVHRWQANSSTELQMYGAGGATNVSSSLLEFSGTGVFRI